MVLRWTAVSAEVEYLVEDSVRAESECGVKLLD